MDDDLLTSSAWMEHALCGRTRFPELWFPKEGEIYSGAVEICAKCPVRRECLEYAIDNHIDRGIWGGEFAP